MRTRRRCSTLWRRPDTADWITCIVGKKYTRCSAIAERPRCRVRYSFRQKYKTGTGRQYFTDSI